MIRVSSLILLCLAIAAHVRGAKPQSGQDENPEMAKMLKEAQALAKARKSQAAIAKCDKIIAACKAQYGSGREKVYCAHTSAETLGYLLMSAAGNSQGKGPGSARVVSSTWSDAYYVKGYALIDLGKKGEAKTALQQAVALSPWYSQYLNELGHVYQSEKNWAKAMDVFKLAEDQAALSPDEIKSYELGRARRGLAYVLVELGKLEAAEKKYRQCLATDPNDASAARELEYVRGLRAKGKSK
jgi:tetratricopeptide (TPR) repeat protein